MKLVNFSVALALVFSASSATAWADERWGLDALMQSLAQIRHGHATFIEKKFIAILDKPVESSGELFYTAPDRLEKRTLKPRLESMQLDRGTLTIEQKGKYHVLPLQSYPEIAAFIDSIRATLAGDRAALERVYQLRLSGEEQAWVLELQPLSERMKKVIRKIRILGERQALRSIEIQQADGDRSLMTITQATAP